MQSSDFNKHKTLCISLKIYSHIKLVLSISIVPNFTKTLNKSLHIVCFVLRWYAIMTYSAVLSNNEEDHIHVLEIDMKEKMR